jgi:hypothetical protein
MHIYDVLFYYYGFPPARELQKRMGIKVGGRRPRLPQKYNVASGRRTRRLMTSCGRS